MMPEDVKGIQRNPDNLGGVLRTATRYINSSWTNPGANAMNSIKRAKEETNKTLS